MGNFTGKENFPPSRVRVDIRSGGSTVGFIENEVVRR